MTTRPTTLNSMTHYALTEDQEEVMAAEDDGEALMDALSSTPSDPTSNRTTSAVESGLLIPLAELRQMMGGPPSPDEEEMRRQEEEQRQQEQQQYQEEQTDARR